MTRLTYRSFVSVLSLFPQLRSNIASAPHPNALLQQGVIKLLVSFANASVKSFEIANSRNIDQFPVEQRPLVLEYQAMPKLFMEIEGVARNLVQDRAHLQGFSDLDLAEASKAELFQGGKPWLAVRHNIASMLRVSDVLSEITAKLPKDAANLATLLEAMYHHIHGVTRPALQRRHLEVSGAAVDMDVYYGRPLPDCNALKSWALHVHQEAHYPVNDADFVAALLVAAEKTAQTKTSHANERVRKNFITALMHFAKNTRHDVFSAKWLEQAQVDLALVVT